MTPVRTDFPPCRPGAVSPPSQPADVSRPDPIDVLLVDDDCVASYSLWALLRWQPGIRICATARSGAGAITAVQRLRPGVCLVSAALGSGEGIRVARRLKQLSDPPRVLIYAAETLELEALGEAAVIVDGVVWRYGDPDELAATIRRVVWSPVASP